jgi:Nuclease-related domain/AAA domain
MAVLRPSLEDCSQLVTPLNDGERRVAEALDRLDDGWTVYVQPRLGLDVPDFVAVHDRHGVCIIEVKDWAPRRYRSGTSAVIEFSRGDGTWQVTAEKPRYQAYRYRTAIHDQFFALPDDDPDPPQAVRSVVILPKQSTRDAVRLLEAVQVTAKEETVRVLGGDALHDPVALVRGPGCPRPPRQSIARLERHLAESSLMIELREPLRISAGARNIERNTSNARFRRVRGPAGCGKTFGLAARAAKLASQGQRVLVLTFNVTLSHYLRTLVTARCRDYAANPTLVTCTNFHGLCRRVVDDAGLVGITPRAHDHLPPFDQTVARAADVLAAGFDCRYDAVLIDEGQDFTLDWWNLLRRDVLVDGGEMLLVADPTQDVYGKRAWTEEARMLGAGFSGPWTELEGSYRMPADLVQIVNEFAEQFLDGERLVAGVPRDRLEITGPSAVTCRRWRYVGPTGNVGRHVGLAVVDLLDHDPGLSPSDIVFLCETHAEGLQAVRVLEACGHAVHHMFGTDDADRSRRKRRFWPDAPGIKGSTVHSFKGWEARALVIGIRQTAESRRLAYVALTRVKADRLGRPAYVSVVNSDPSLESFGAAFVAPAIDWSPPHAAMRVAVG